MSSPNPTSLNQGVTTLVPLYIKNLGDYNTQGSTLNIINSEYSQRINLAATMLKVINSSSAGIEQNISPIKASLTSATTTIGSLQSSVSGMASGFLDPMVSLVKNI